MVVDGSKPDSLEYQVLLSAHRNGAAVEYCNQNGNTWFPRTPQNIGKDFMDMMLYRLAPGEQNDSDRK